MSRRHHYRLHYSSIVPLYRPRIVAKMSYSGGTSEISDRNWLEDSPGGVQKFLYSSEIGYRGHQWGYPNGIFGKNKNIFTYFHCPK